MTDTKAQILIGQGALQVGIVMRKGDEHAVIIDGNVNWYPINPDSPSTLSLSPRPGKFEMPEGLSTAIAEAKEQGQRIAMHDGNAVFFSCDGDSELPGHDASIDAEIGKGT